MKHDREKVKHDREKDKFGGDDLHLDAAVDIRSQSSDSWRVGCGYRRYPLHVTMP